MKVDIHTHILPPDLPRYAQKFGYGKFVHLELVDRCTGHMVQEGKVFRKVAPNCWDPGARIEECDSAGVSVQVLSTVPVLFNYWAKAKDGLEVCRFLNDHIAGVVRSNPRRFVGLATLPMQDPVLASRELERAVKELGLAGAEIGTNVEGRSLGEEEFFPVFETAERLGAALFVHPWNMIGEERMKKYWLPWLVGMPAELSLAICSMIFGGVFERYPRLRVAFAHGGGAFPGTFGRIERGFDSRPDLCAVDNAKSPREYLGRFWVDSLTHSADSLRFALKLFGEDRVALGSDYPFPLGEERPGTMIASMKDLGAKTRAKLLAGNALEWLGRRAEDFK